MKKIFFAMVLVGCGADGNDKLFETSTSKIETTSTKTSDNTGGNTSTSTSEDGGFAGAGGSNVGGGGNGGEVTTTSEETTTSSESTSSSNDGGGGSGGNGVGGEECIPTITCSILQAHCGFIKDNGCGQSEECPDNCIAPAYCGGGGEQFKCGCTPKKCEENNCGEMDDGCVNKLNCGNCPVGIYIKCGGIPAPNPDGSQKEAIIGVCGGGCTFMENQENGICNFLDLPPFLFKCSEVGIYPPKEGCKPRTGFEKEWCCPTY